MNHIKLDGIIPIYKEAGMSSHDVVAKLRRILGIKKIGHTGTLDPEVTGVLPICIGKATRLSEYIMEMPKTYNCQCTIGIATTTEDFTGEIIENVIVKNFSEEKLLMVTNEFVGVIEQIPPMYSAVKINGKRLYKSAREGIEIERTPRTITIHSINIDNIKIEDNYPKIDFTVKCSKGTYVRTLCVDIGLKLGYPAHMSYLQRIESGSFKIEQAYKLNEIEDYVSKNKINEIIISMNDSLPFYDEVVLSEDVIRDAIFNGKIINIENLEFYKGIIKILNSNSDLVALYQKENNNSAKPVKIFKY